LAGSYLVPMTGEEPSNFEGHLFHDMFYGIKWFFVASVVLS